MENLRLVQHQTGALSTPIDFLTKVKIWADADLIINMAKGIEQLASVFIEQSC
jgi:hypothetical protein